MRRGMISKIMVVFVALAMVAIIPFKLNADMALVIVSDPVDYIGEIGETATFTVEAMGENLTYQWQYKNSTGKWRDSSSSGFDTPSLSIKVTEARDGQQYQCIVSDGVNSVTSRPAAIQVHKERHITSNPANYTGEIGETATFTVSATGNNLKYQWQYKHSNSSWKNSSSTGFDTPSLSVAITEARIGQKYRCIVTDADNCSVTSKAGTIKLKAPITIDSEPADVTGKVGKYAVFTVEATGSNLTYQWQYMNASGVWKNSNSTGYNTNSMKIKITEARNGQQYQCIISDDKGNTLTSRAAVIQVEKDTFNVTFDAGTGKFANGASTITKPFEQGYYFLKEQEMPDQDGYFFNGWLYNGKAVNYCEIKSDMTVTADWIKIYKVTYNANGGVFPDEDNAQSFYVEVLPGNYYVDSNSRIPERPGYAFSGWKVRNKVVGKTLRISSDVELVAQWVPGVIVTYDANGGHWGYGDGEYDTISFPEPKGTYFVTYDEPYREGYSFEGWKVNGNWTGRINLTEDITAVAVWKKYVEVTYDPNGGGWMHSYIDENTGDEVWFLDTDPEKDWYEAGVGNASHNYPECDGYWFLGWNTNSAATTGSYDFEYDFEKDVTFYAIWEKMAVYTYDAGEGFFGRNPANNDGNDQEGPGEEPYKTKTEYVREGEYYYIRNEIPWRNDGYEFDCWVDAHDNDISDKETIANPNVVTHVTARWKKIITITYDANGGEFNNWDEGETKYVHYRDGRERDLYVIDGWRPEREGYEFAGWLGQDELIYNEDEETHMWPEITLGNKDLVFTAQWLKRVRVTYDANGGQFDGFDGGNGESPSIHFRDGVEGRAFEVDGWNPQRDGYIFVGWSTDSEVMEAIPARYSSSDVTLYAIWQEPAKVTYHATLGNWGRDEQDNPFLTYEQYQNDGGDYWIDGRWPNEVEGNYRLIGFSTSADSSEVVYELGDFIEFLDGDLDLYTVWYKLPTIHYVSGIDGVTFHDGQTEHLEWDEAGHYYYVRHESPETEQYWFLGWEDKNGADYSDVRIKLEEGKEYYFYAKWEERIPLWTVKYMPNGGCFYDDDPEFFESWENEDTNTYDVGCWWPHREGYDFVGWSLDPNTDSNDPNLSQGWIMELHQDETFYAIWERRTVVTYDAGDGQFSVYTGDNEQGVPQYDEPKSVDKYVIAGTTLLVNTFDEPYRSGYSFEGWMLNGELVNSIEVGTEDITLEAKWLKECTVTLDAGEGKFYDDEATLDYYFYDGDFVLTAFLFEEPERDGYIFGGWMLNGEEINSFMVEGDMTLEAIWIPDPRV